MFLRNLVLNIHFQKNESGLSVSSVWDGHSDADNFEKVLKNTLANYTSAKKYREKILLPIPPAPKPLFYRGATYLKITTNKEGIYRVTGKDLQDSGTVLEKINPRTLRLYNLGREVPIWVSNSNRKTFENGDAITFFATHPPKKLNTYTDENVYWLTWGGKDGKRMQEKNAIIGDSVNEPFSFKMNHHYEEDHVYMGASPPEHGSPSWFWARISAGMESTNKRYFVIPSVSGIDRGKKFTLRFSLQGLTDDPNTDRDHHAIISVNDHKIDDCIWSGQSQVLFRGEFFF